MGKGGWMDGWDIWDVLIPRNPLLRTAIPSDADDDAAVVGLHAVGCFEAGDDLRKSPVKVSFAILS
jgi:hypothetical protein